ncbi:MAG: hypothetical protein ACPLYW_03090, partial [Candidatus Nanoarchaeia archaeon]
MASSWGLNMRSHNPLFVYGFVFHICNGVYKRIYILEYINALSTDFSKGNAVEIYLKFLIFQTKLCSNSIFLHI